MVILEPLLGIEVWRCGRDVAEGLVATEHRGRGQERPARRFIFAVIGIVDLQARDGPAPGLVLNGDADPDPVSAGAWRYGQRLR